MFASASLVDPWVRFYFSDADPIAECQCGWHAHGDAAVDAFHAWWQHRREKHPLDAETAIPDDAVEAAALDDA